MEQHLKKLEELLANDKNWRKEIKESITELNEALREETIARKEHIIELQTLMEKEQREIKTKIDTDAHIYKGKSETNSKWLASLGVAVGVLGLIVAIAVYILR